MKIVDSFKKALPWATTLWLGYGTFLHLREIKNPDGEYNRGVQQGKEIQSKDDAKNITTPLKKQIADLTTTNTTQKQQLDTDAQAIEQQQAELDKYHKDFGTPGTPTYKSLQDMNALRNQAIRNSSGESGGDTANIRRTVRDSMSGGAGPSKDLQGIRRMRAQAMQNASSGSDKETAKIKKTVKDSMSGGTNASVNDMLKGMKALRDKAIKDASGAPQPTSPPTQKTEVKQAPSPPSH